jgi:predicted RNA-binding protein Jag
MRKMRNLKMKFYIVEEKEAAASENDDSIIYQIHKFEEEWSDEDETNESTKSDPTKFSSKLSGKIAQLYEKMDISDVSLCVSGKKIKVLFFFVICTFKLIYPF